MSDGEGEGTDKKVGGGEMTAAYFSANQASRTAAREADLENRSKKKEGRGIINKQTNKKGHRKPESVAPT